MAFSDKVLNVSKNPRGGHNPGVITFLSKLASEKGEQEASELIDELLKNNIQGNDVWYLYDDESHKDIETMKRSLKDQTAIPKLKKNSFSSFFEG